MLSQLRWILGVAIGVAVIVAVWLEPDVRDPAGEPAVPRPAHSGLSAKPAEAPPPSTEGPSAEALSDEGPADSSPVEWQNRLHAYWADVDRILRQRRGNTRDHEKIREALRARHFSVDERPAVRALDAGRAR